MTAVLIILALIGWLAFLLLCVVFRIMVNGLSAVCSLQRDELVVLRKLNSDTWNMLVEATEAFDELKTRREEQS